MDITAPLPGSATLPILLPPGSNSLSAASDPLLRAYSLPCTLVLEAPVQDFHVGSLLSLAVGSIVQTTSQHNEDLILKVNGQMFGMVEFDVMGENLAVRLTGMA